MTMTTAVPSSDLARLSSDLKSLNAKPLWERTTRMGPGTPALPAIWRYQDMRPQLLRAVDLITAKQAERRVFMLENPGLLGSGYITSCSLLRPAGDQTGRDRTRAPPLAERAARHHRRRGRILHGRGRARDDAARRFRPHPRLDLARSRSSRLGAGDLARCLDNPFGQFFGAIFREEYPHDTHPVTHADGDAAARYGSSLLPIEQRAAGAHRRCWSTL